MEMRFRSLFKALYYLSLLSLFLDFTVTQIGFLQYPWIFEKNRTSGY